MLAKKIVTSKTLLTSRSDYEKEIIAAGGRLKHNYTANNHKTIELTDGKTFTKNVQEVFPAEFTAWISGVDLAAEARPVKGKKRWTDYPTLTDDARLLNPNDQVVSYWQLLPTTSDTQLKKVAKQNLTVARIVDEWRRKWQTTSRWTMAEIDELIADMGDESASVRFQAVVVCTRAVEQVQLMVEKVREYDRKFPSGVG